MNLSTRQAIEHVLAQMERDELKLAHQREQLDQELAEVNAQLEGIRRRKAELLEDLRRL